MKHVETDDYQGPDRRYRPTGIRGVLTEAYDLGALVRGAVQVIAIGSVVIVAWSRLENSTANNRDRILALEATTKAHGEQISKFPAVWMEQAGALRETLATLTERIEGLRQQLERVQQSLDQQRRYPDVTKSPR